MNNQVPKSKEQYCSHIPALNTLMTCSWQFLSAEACMVQRGNNRELLLKSNLITFLQYLFEPDYLKQRLGRLVITGDQNNGLLNIKPSEFLKTTVPAPHTDEQKTIAKIIRTATEEIELHQKSLACLIQEKKALMQQLLTGKRRVKVDP